MRRQLPLPTPAPAVEEGGSRVGALAAAVLAALGGGLVWAGVVIVTKYDIGILAWLVGAATGYAVHRLGGSTVTVADRAIAAVLAACGILLGKYVIFVHELKDALRAIFHTNPRPSVTSTRGRCTSSCTTSRRSSAGRTSCGSGSPCLPRTA